MGEPNPSPTEHAEVPDLVDDDEVWRRIPPEKVIFDSTRNTFRPSSDCFNNHPNKTPMPAFLARVCKDPNLALEGNEGFALVAIRVDTMHRCGQLILPAYAEGSVPGHVHIAGFKSASTRKIFAKECRWIVQPSEEIKTKAKNRALGIS
jgi:hypothetical protein